MLLEIIANELNWGLWHMPCCCLL